MVCGGPIPIDSCCNVLKRAEESSGPAVFEICSALGAHPDPVPLRGDERKLQIPRLPGLHSFVHSVDH